MEHDEESEPERDNLDDNDAGLDVVVQACVVYLQEDGKNDDGCVCIAAISTNTTNARITQGQGVLQE